MSLGTRLVKPPSFQPWSDTIVSFKFELDKITIQLPTGNPFTFPVRLPIEVISYLAMI
ncbi:unnamed protein product, partial [Staurois parvus]